MTRRGAQCESEWKKSVQKCDHIQTLFMAHHRDLLLGQYICIQSPFIGGRNSHYRWTKERVVSVREWLAVAVGHGTAQVYFSRKPANTNMKCNRANSPQTAQYKKSALPQLWTRKPLQPRITTRARRGSDVLSGGTRGGHDRRAVGEKLPSAFTAIIPSHPYPIADIPPLSQPLLQVKCAGRAVAAAKRQLSFHRGCFNSQCQ